MIQVTVRATVRGSPEADTANMPLIVLPPELGNEAHVGQETIQNAGVKNHLPLQLLAHVLIADGLVTRQVQRVVQLELLGIEADLATPLVLLDHPPMLDPRQRVAVNDGVRARLGHAVPNEPGEFPLATGEGAQLLIGDKVRRHDKPPMQPVIAWKPPK